MKALIVDDHELIRKALRAVLADLKYDAEILEASTCSECMRFIAEDPGIVLVLLDLMLPDGNSLGMVADLRKRRPGVSFIIVSGIQDRDTIVRTLNLGVVGFIPKTTDRAVILGALQLIFAGGRYVPPEILSGDKIRDQGRLELVHEAASPADMGLTRSESKVLSLIVEGKNNKDICHSLQLSESTVKTHVSTLLRKWRVKSRTELVIAVYQRGWQLQQPKAAQASHVIEAQLNPPPKR